MVVGLLVFVLAIGAAMLARNFWEQRKLDLALEAIDLLPEVAQRIQDFHRVKFDGGRKIWEVSAKEARYFDDEGVVSVRGPVVEIYFEEGRSVALRGDEGKVILDGSDVESVEVEGRIDVKLDEYALRTDFARYETETDRIVVPGSVRVESAQVEFDGEAMEIDVGDQRLRVKQGVQMTLWPKG